MQNHFTDVNFSGEGLNKFKSPYFARFFQKYIFLKKSIKRSKIQYLVNISITKSPQIPTFCPAEWLVDSTLQAPISQLFDSVSKNTFDIYKNTLFVVHQVFKITLRKVFVFCVIYCHYNGIVFPTWLID